MATQAEVIRNNRERETARQVAATNFGEPQVQELNGIPASASTSNDAALAAHLKETRDKSAEYALLRSADAREQWESIAANNFLRDQRNKELIKEQVSAAKVNQEHSDNAQGEWLALQIQTLTDSFPQNWTPENLPMEQLRQLTDLRQQVNRLAAATGAPGLADGVLESGGPLAAANVLKQQQAQPQAKHETFPDGQAVHVSQNQDGTMTVEYATGERFTGDPLTVTQKIGQAHVNTKLWARQQRAQQPQQMTEPQLNQEPQQQIISPEPTQQSTIADYWAEQQAAALAKQFGFGSKEELLQWGENVNQKMAAVSQYEDERLASEFLSRCQDFPSTPEASEAIANIVQNNGWQWNADSLQAAHLLAVKNHMYEPISPEQPQPARIAPPPMLRTSNPELASNQANDPWNMSMQDLRKAAIAQELDRNSPGYR
jgi:hypothetical protein